MVRQSSELVTQQGNPLVLDIIIQLGNIGKFFSSNLFSKNIFFLYVFQFLSRRAP